MSSCKMPVCVSEVVCVLPASPPGVFFIPANTPIAVEARDDVGLELWLAGVNSQVFAKGARA